MPTLGYGLFQVPVDIAKRCVKDAIDTGESSEASQDLSKIIDYYSRI